MIVRIEGHPRIFPSVVPLGAARSYLPPVLYEGVWRLSFPEEVTIGNDLNLADLALFSSEGIWDTNESLAEGDHGVIYEREVGSAHAPDGTWRHAEDASRAVLLVGDYVRLGDTHLVIEALGVAQEPPFSDAEWNPALLERVNAPRAWAKNPALPEDACHMLAQCPDVITLRSLAENPALPSELFPFMAEFFAHEIAKNQGFSFYQLDDPDLSRFSPARRAFIRRTIRNN